jgi:hypothetical protein
VCRLASTLVVRVRWRRRWSCASAGVDVGRARRSILTEAVVGSEFLLVCTGHHQNWGNTRSPVHTNRNSGWGTGPVVKERMNGATHYTKKNTEIEKSVFFHQPRLCMSAGVRVDSMCRLASTLVVRVGWRRRWSCASAGVDVGRARRSILTEAVVGYRPRSEFLLVCTGPLVFHQF